MCIKKPLEAGKKATKRPRINKKALKQKVANVSNTFDNFCAVVRRLSSHNLL